MITPQQPTGGDPRRDGAPDFWAAFVDGGARDIARPPRGGESWPDNHDESGCPTKEHCTWGVRRRRLDRKAGSYSVGDVDLALDQLRLPTRDISTSTYQDPIRLERVTLGGSIRVCALEVTSHGDPRLSVFIDHAWEGLADDVAFRRFLGACPAAARVEASGSTTFARVALCVERIGDLSRELTWFARSPTLPRGVEVPKERLQGDWEGHWSQRVLTVLRHEQPAVENNRTGVALESTDDGFRFLAPLATLDPLGNVPVRLVRLRHYPLAEMSCSLDVKMTWLPNGLPFATAVRIWMYIRMDSPHVAAVALDWATSAPCPSLARLDLIQEIRYNHSTIEDSVEVGRGYSIRSSLLQAVQHAEQQSLRRADEKRIDDDATREDIGRLVINSMDSLQDAPNVDAQAPTGRAVRALQLTLEPVLINPLFKRLEGPSPLLTNHVFGIWADPAP